MDTAGYAGLFLLFPAGARPRRMPELGAAIGRLQTIGSDGYAMVLLQALFGREARARVRVDGLELVDAG